MKKSENGMSYFDFRECGTGAVHLSYGNAKTGQVLAYNVPIHNTCTHACECYKTRACYACGGFYAFESNQRLYAENLAYFMNHSSADFVAAVVDEIRRAPKKCQALFRWFTCGDILSLRFFGCMVEIARQCPGVRFWCYTKKYQIVNRWIAENGAIPENLAIIFSHWMNADGSFFEMPNPYNLPTSEYIPAGSENLATAARHICPCSNPAVKATCAGCDHPCYTLKAGESMALLEHSTPATKTRDKALKKAHNGEPLTAEERAALEPLRALHLIAAE